MRVTLYGCSSCCTVKQVTGIYHSTGLQHFLDFFSSAHVTYADLSQTNAFHVLVAGVVNVICSYVCTYIYIHIHVHMFVDIYIYT